LAIFDLNRARGPDHRFGLDTFCIRSSCAEQMANRGTVHSRIKNVSCFDQSPQFSSASRFTAGASGVELVDPLHKRGGRLSFGLTCEALYFCDVLMSGRFASALLKWCFDLRQRKLCSV
jgi:hypothetical protein